MLKKWLRHWAKVSHIERPKKLETSTKWLFYRSIWRAGTKSQRQRRGGGTGAMSRQQSITDGMYIALYIIVQPPLFFNKLCIDLLESITCSYSGCFYDDISSSGCATSWWRIPLRKVCEPWNSCEPRSPSCSPTMFLAGRAENCEIKRNASHSFPIYSDSWPEFSIPRKEKL